MSYWKIARPSCSRLLAAVTTASLPCRLHGGQQERDQEGDDGNDDEKLDSTNCLPRSPFGLHIKATAH